ncbi:unnamed protein product [Ilex paraguariensis]|uniref:Uncharacterized protein n=1 Tax=Ilex paraguariensis TaxID=185542 RepID=A0ABC8S1L9_9AQUA
MECSRGGLVVEGCIRAGGMDGMLNGGTDSGEISKTPAGGTSSEEAPEALPGGTRGDGSGTQGGVERGVEGANVDGVVLRDVIPPKKKPPNIL